MDYVEQIKNYIIIGGSVQKASDFSLWQYQPNSQHLNRIDVSGWNKLCRPESVLPIIGSKQFYIIGEHSGEACKEQKIDYLLISA